MNDLLSNVCISFLKLCGLRQEEYSNNNSSRNNWSCMQYPSKMKHDNSGSHSSEELQTSEEKKLQSK